MQRTILRAGLIAITSCAAFGQPAAAPAVFEVASIKLAKPLAGIMKGPVEGSVSLSPGNLNMRNVTLKDVIGAAYDMKEYQILGPASLNSERYDILAKAAGPVPPDRLKLMLQALLADRFKLALHREAKDLSMYALVVGKSAPKLHAGNPDGESSTQIDGGRMVFQNYSMSKLASYLSQRSADRPVQDSTGLDGVFDFAVRLADSPSDNPIDVKRALGQAMRDGSFATVVAEQIGLKLEPRKGPVAILVIDHAEKSSEN